MKQCLSCTPYTLFTQKWIKSKKSNTKHTNHSTVTYIMQLTWGVNNMWIYAYIHIYMHSMSNQTQYTTAPVQLHPRKLTCPLKRDHFNGIVIFQPLIFRGHVSFQGVNGSLPLKERLVPASYDLFVKIAKLQSEIDQRWSIHNDKPLREESTTSTWKHREQIPETKQLGKKLEIWYLPKAPLSRLVKGVHHPNKRWKGLEGCGRIWCIDPLPNLSISTMSTKNGCRCGGWETTGMVGVKVPRFLMTFLENSSIYLLM